MKTETIVSTASAEIQNLNTEASAPTDLHPGLVSVVAAYPEGYTGPRHMIAGKSYPMSQEVADQLIAKGLGVLAGSVAEAPAAEVKGEVSVGTESSARTEEGPAKEKVADAKKETTSSKPKNDK